MRASAAVYYSAPSAVGGQGGRRAAPPSRLECSAPPLLTAPPAPPHPTACPQLFGCSELVTICPVPEVTPPLEIFRVGAAAVMVNSVNVYKVQTTYPCPYPCPYPYPS